jgi:hypothetical protein
MAENKPAVESALLPIVSPFPTRSEQLVLRAEGLYNLGGDDKLEAEDRRDALQCLMLVRPDLSNVELGRYFKVNEKIIRLDKDTIRKRMVDEVGDKDIALVVSDLMRSHEQIMVRLAKSTKACQFGTSNYLNHLKFEQEASHKMIELLQSLGVYPKNLGNLTKTQFIYKAHVAKGGGVNVATIETQEELHTIEAQEVKLLPGAYETDEDREIRAALAAEFADGGVKAPTEPAASTASTPLAERIKRGPS